MGNTTNWGDSDPGTWKPADHGYGNPQGTYSIRVRCVNCNYTGFRSFPKGQPVLGQVCTECGCRSITKL